jgi:hypothetical protein
MSEQAIDLNTERAREANPVLTSEDVAYWYLRLNGFLTLKNFLVHGDRRGEERTEIDVLGVRFQHRREHFANPMEDDAWITKAASTIVVFCDAKRGARDFNDSWTRRDRRVMESFLALVGIVPQIRWRKVAQDLYRRGQSSPKKGLLLTTLLVHHDPSSMAPVRWPDAPRVQLGHALRFIHERFEIYRNIKSAHTQWDASGHRLWDLYDERRGNADEFVSTVLLEIGCEGVVQAEGEPLIAFPAGRLVLFCEEVRRLPQQQSKRSEPDTDFTARETQKRLPQRRREVGKRVFTGVRGLPGN